jgi:hypothetical protein
MSDPRDPTSLLDDASLGQDVRSVLEAASEHEPSAAELAALGKRLAGALPPGSLPPEGGGSGGGGAVGVGAGGAAGTGAGLTGKIVVALALGGALAAAISALPGGQESPRAPETRASSAPAPPSSALASPPSALASASAPSPALASAPSPALASASAPSPSPALASAPSVPFAPSSASASARASLAPAPAEPEGVLLARAHDALLHGSPQRALALAAEHGRAYPHGALAQEREVIAIEALAAAGRHDEARARAATFRAAYPGSSHQARIDRLVERAPPP